MSPKILTAVEMINIGGLGFVAGALFTALVIKLRQQRSAATAIPRDPIELHGKGFVCSEKFCLRDVARAAVSGMAGRHSANPAPGVGQP